jgi:hypothetical protein
VRDGDQGSWDELDIEKRLSHVQVDDLESRDNL